MKYPQAIVSVLVLSVYVLVGVPVWWNTTKVYRATLPRQKITELKGSPIKLKLDLDVLSAFHTDVQMVGIRDSLLDRQNIHQSRYGLSWNVNLQQTDLDLRANPLEYCQERNSTSFVFYIFQSSTVKSVENHFCPDSLTLVMKLSLDLTTSQIVDLLWQAMSQVTPGEDLKAYSENKTPVKMFSIPPSPGYQINFILAIADPSEYLSTWDVQTAQEIYLEPILLAFDFIGPFKVSSQVHYYPHINTKPKSDKDGFYYTQSKLPSLINPIESRLASHTSTNPCLNFVVYVPEKKHTPLYVKQKSSKTLAFHSPRWGGFLFFNPPNNETVVPLETMLVFTEQFRILIGDSNLQHPLSWSSMKISISRTFEYIRTCLSTLSSLTSLLDEIANIVIRDDIQEFVLQAIANVEKSVTFLARGDYRRAHACAKQAFLDSEKAFYDSSLLHLLYFPDDQKYAVYVPLFLPISIPIVTTFVKAMKWLLAGGK